MEFVFHLSAYGEPDLESEAAELLRQRLEARSRQTLPGLWKVTDGLNARTVEDAAAARRRKRCRVCGVFLIALGIFVLVPGLMEPRIPGLIFTGGLAVLAGLLELRLAGAERGAGILASCRKEAEELLKRCRETDWETLRAEVCFDGVGWSVATVEGSSRTSYCELQSVFETERLWMLVDDKDRALLLQKGDLIQGDPGVFLPYLREKITE